MVTRDHRPPALAEGLFYTIKLPIEVIVLIFPSLPTVDKLRVANFGKIYYLIIPFIKQKSPCDDLLFTFILEIFHSFFTLKRLGNVCGCWWWVVSF